MRAWVLEAGGLSKRFGRVEALREASFRAAPQKITAFLGENGAGKTTALRLILGFLRPDSGRVRLSVGPVGYVPERPVFFPWLRGREVIEATAAAFGLTSHEAERLVAPLCRRLRFDSGLLERKVQTYSLGNQKKFSYLQSLIISPELLIVDEPFAALDPVAIKSARELFLELKSQGKTLLLSSHLIAELEKVCDEFIVLKEGRVVVQEDFARLRTGYVLVRLDGPRPDFAPQGAWPSHVKGHAGPTRALVPARLLAEDPALAGEIIGGPNLDLETLFLFFAE
jgi:ABC-2 type transport system ATP-binding protein